jgi:hypothetical protein
LSPPPATVSGGAQGYADLTPPAPVVPGADITYSVTFTGPFAPLTSGGPITYTTCTTP